MTWKIHLNSNSNLGLKENHLNTFYFMLLCSLVVFWT